MCKAESSSVCSIFRIFGVPLRQKPKLNFNSMKKAFSTLVGLLPLLVPQTASAQSDALLSDKDSQRIMKIATQTSRLHYEAATEAGFKMDHC